VSGTFSTDFLVSHTGVNQSGKEIAVDKEPAPPGIVGRSRFGDDDFISGLTLIVAGMLPIAFGRGAGAGSRASIAVTIIGGQMLCLLLTLLISPVVYSYFDDLREWEPRRLLAWLRRAGRPAPPEPEIPG